RLARDDRPRQTTAMLCRLTQLGAWADSVTTDHLTSIRAAMCGDDVLLLGRRLPALANCERFWGRRVLAPLGYRLEPTLPESELLDAWEVDEEEFVLIHTEQVEIVSQNVFEPLTRARIRLALRESALAR